MLKLPHPEVATLLDAIKRDVIRVEQRTIADTALSYAVFRTEVDTHDLAFYDTDGMVYIPEELIQLDAEYADLIALHEHVEIQHKRAGRPHAYAHRRALQVELLVAKQIFQAHQLEGYLRWRIGLYPEWKNLDQAAIVTELIHLLAPNRPQRGALFQLIKDHML